MKKAVKFIVVLLLIASTPLMAQQYAGSGDEGGFKKENLFVGGGLSASFGNVVYIEASPVVGYRVKEFWRVGVGYSFRYLNYRDFDYKAIINGGSAFTQVDLFAGIFAQLEFEYLNLTQVSGELRASAGYPGLLAGGGYNMPVGQNSVMQIIALYNFLYDSTILDLQPYNSPLIIRIGFQMGF